jgi:tetratricopeptide (TPR) repeat protein
MLGLADAMAEPSFNPDQHLLPVDPPDWLGEAVRPWTIRAAALWRAGLMLELESARARVPVLIEAGAKVEVAIAISILDPRIADPARLKFARALHARLAPLARLRDWLTSLRAVTDLLEGRRSLAPDDPLDRLLALWSGWPVREQDPGTQIAPLPDGLASASWPRAARAALAMHRFASAQVLDGLTQWAELPPCSGSPSFTELHLDGIVFGLLGLRERAAAALARAEAVADTGDRWLAIARAYEAAEQPDPAIAAYERVVAIRGRDWDRLRLARARGGFAAGEAIPKPRSETSEAGKCSFMRELIKILDAAGRDDDCLIALTAALDELDDPRAPAAADLTLVAARLHLWRREAPEARARLARCPAAAADPQGQLILAALTLLDGDAEQALAQLLAIPEGPETGPARLERLLWICEARLALGDLDGALAAVDEHIVLENSLVAYLLKLLVLIRHQPETLAPSLASRTFLDALVVDVLPTLRSPAQIAAATPDPVEFAALIRGILDDMGGNRSARPTWRREGPAGVVLERVAVRPSGRDAAVAVLTRIRTEPPEQVLAGFDAVLAEYPHSPHPCTYRGELLIWLGRYADALASFDEADARAPTRWSFVGRAAAYDLLGEAEAADHWTAAGIERFGELATATTHVYRGERSRKLGDWLAARRDLETALAHKTRRIGARINLALAYAALGERALYAEQLARLAVDAPAFVWEAGGRAGPSALDEATLLTMLERMVGNRSSFLHTMIDGEGRFRVVPEPTRWIAHARLSLATAREPIERMLAAALA